MLALIESTYVVELLTKRPNPDSYQPAGRSVILMYCRRYQSALYQDSSSEILYKVSCGVQYFPILKAQISCLHCSSPYSAFPPILPFRVSSIPAYFFTINDEFQPLDRLAWFNIGIRCCSYVHRSLPPLPEGVEADLQNHSARSI